MQQEALGPLGVDPLGRGPSLKNCVIQGGQGIRKGSQGYLTPALSLALLPEIPVW